MRALLVTYYFPPAGGGGVQRVLGWCRHLPEFAVEVTVAAPAEPHWVDADPTLVIPPTTQVIRTADPSPGAVIPRDALAQVTGLRRLLRRIALQPRRFALPDIHARWRRPAVRAILAAARELPAGERWDIVVSSSPPETTHLIARDVARALDIPWVADLRDSWLDLPHLRLDRLAPRVKHARSVRLARRLLTHASAATTVSQPLALDLRRRHPDLPVHVIENGVEPSDVARAAPRADGYREPDRFVVLYSGNFFGRQSATSMLHATERLLRDRPDLADTLVLRFIGGLKPADRARIEASPLLAAVVDHVDFLRHDDVLAHQRAADLLFLYVAPGTGSQGVYTGKVFEYVAARRPVLALVPADNVCVELLARAGSTTQLGGARVDPDDVDAIAAALVAAHDVWREQPGAERGDVDVPAAVLTRIDRATGARQLADLLADTLRG
ncbi:MAG: group 1 glycosyl transferase [Thermoleophilia bacterium]|nr:group 1 glycosyl transferase [Thermoleophilia bacterium]